MYDNDGPCMPGTFDMQRPPAVLGGTVGVQWVAGHYRSWVTFGIVRPPFSGSIAFFAMKLPCRQQATGRKLAREKQKKANGPVYQNTLRDAAAQKSTTA